MNLKVISSIAVVASIAIQFIPYGKDHTNPPVMSEPQWDSNRTKELFTQACADCHSNVTKYPWYSNIAPVSWLVMHDIDEGREKLNISMLGIQKKNKVKDAADEVKEGEMPILPYLIAHPEARLSDSEKKELADGLEKTFGKEEKGK
jgi:mono/diheme cytochrome c family protein